MSMLKQRCSLLLADKHTKEQIASCGSLIPDFIYKMTHQEDGEMCEVITETAGLMRGDAPSFTAAAVPTTKAA